MRKWWELWRKFKQKAPMECAFVFVKDGGDEGGRTPDLCNAIAALCQTELRPQKQS